MGGHEAPGRNRLLILAGVIVAVLLIGALITHTASNPPTSSAAPEAEAAAPARPVAPGTPVPAGEAAGMPVGFAPGEHGAVVAAVAYATAPQRWLYFTDEEIRAAIDQIATPAAAPRMADDIVAEVAIAREQLGASSGRVWWLVRPLAWEVELHDGNEARVSVWVVTVLSAAEVAAPQSEWMTVTLDLAWVDGDWRVDAVRDAPGPTPIIGPKDRPWDAEPFDETLSGFTRMDGEPVQ